MTENSLVGKGNKKAAFVQANSKRVSFIEFLKVMSAPQNTESVGCLH